MREVKLPDLSEIRDDVEFKPSHMDNEPTYRPVVGVSLGCELGGLASPHVDTTDPLTSLGGMGKRLAFRPPWPVKVKLRKIRRFTLRWCRRNLTPLSPDSDVSFETWIANAPYTQVRKDQLTKIYEEKCSKDPYYNVYFAKRKGKITDTEVMSFIKDETYDEYKYSRGIYSRTDVFKVIVAPVIKLIENEIYKTEYADNDYRSYFIKKVPVSQRPQEIMEMYSADAIYAATDYTSFEGHFKSCIMKCIEGTVYEYMIQLLPCAAFFRETFLRTIYGLNACNFYYFVILIEATRMSGEMNTSLGNGISNLLIMLFICEQRGLPPPRGYVEGDDGIFRFMNKHNVPTIADYADLGFTIKIEWHKSLATASFCGIIFSEEDLNNITDPISTMIGFGWTTRRYCRSKDKKLKELLKAKSFSLLYSYPGCPILRNLAEYGLRVTQDSRFLFNPENTYEREKVISMLEYVTGNPKFSEITIGMSTRILVSERYGIPVETQILFEKYLDSLNTIQTLNVDLLMSFIHPDAADYSLRYVCDVDYKRSDLDYLPSYNSSAIPFTRSLIDEINETRNFSRFIPLKR